MGAAVPVAITAVRATTRMREYQPGGQSPSRVAHAAGYCGSWLAREGIFISASGSSHLPATHDSGARPAADRPAGFAPKRRVLRTAALVPGHRPPPALSSRPATTRRATIHYRTT